MCWQWLHRCTVGPASLVGQQLRNLSICNLTASGLQMLLNSVTIDITPVFNSGCFIWWSMSLHFRAQFLKDSKPMKTGGSYKLPGDDGCISLTYFKTFLGACGHQSRHHIGCLAHQGGMRLRPIWNLVWLILLWVQNKLKSLRAVYIPGRLNLGADLLSRHLGSDLSHPSPL